MNSATVLEVLGRNVRARRKASGITLSELARAAGEYGQKWSTGRIGDLEAGRGTASVEVLVVLALSLTHLTGQRVRPLELLEADEGVELGEGFALKAEAFRRVLNGTTSALELDADDILGGLDEAARRLTSSLSSMPSGTGLKFGLVRRALAEKSLADERAARKLGLDDEEFLVRCLSLWGHMMSVEVSRRAGEGASPQKRGRVTRVLLDELKVAGRGDH
ncbi:helix-turn-helix domain-containing protein [Kocuria flava]|uniref:helix-turn-helix domain-containing protein n=1 Tax=Kocuria flava TaxID=446860 RepID=UPI003F195A19